MDGTVTLGKVTNKIQNCDNGYSRDVFRQQDKVWGRGVGGNESSRRVGGGLGDGEEAVVAVKKECDWECVGGGCGNGG